MIVVSNSSPICYLILIEQIHLLPNMMGKLTVPESVIRELSDQRAPEVVRGWAAQPPPWLEVQTVTTGSDPDLNRLHAGERDAIVLAQNLDANLLILDEKAARKVAKKRGLRVTGLVGILDEAATRGMVNLLVAVERISKTNFRVSPVLLKTLLERHFA